MLFGILGSKMTMKLRTSAFSSILQKEIAWFDRVENSSGILTSKLANDAADIQGVSQLYKFTKIVQKFDTNRTFIVNRTSNCNALSSIINDHCFTLYWFHLQLETINSCINIDAIGWHNNRLQYKTLYGTSATRWRDGTNIGKIDN